MGRPKLRKQRRRNTAMVHQLNVEQAIRRWDELNEHTAGANDITLRSAFTHSAWVYSAVSIIAEWMVRNPFVVEHNGRQIDGGPLFNLVTHPNQYGQQNTSVKFRTAYMAELLLGGAVMRVFTSMNGIQPQEMAVFPRVHFTPYWSWDDNGVQVVDKWVKSSTGRSITYIPGDDIFHDALYNPNHDFEGLPPLTAALLGINADVNLGEMLKRFFKNDASLGMIMSTDEPLNQTQIDEAILAWDSVNKGFKNAYRTKFIGYGLKPYTIGTNFDATVQRILKALSRDEIMNGIFRIPSVIYAGELPTEGVQIGSRSSEPEKETFLVTVIMTWASRFDEEFNSDVASRFGRGYRGYHDFSNNPILERRRLDRARQAAELIDRGVTLNAVIKWLNLELDPEPHGNEYWVNQGQVPASVVIRAGDAALNAGGRSRQEFVDAHIDKIAALAQTTLLKEAARAAYRQSDGFNGTDNRQRIEEIMR